MKKGLWITSSILLRTSVHIHTHTHTCELLQAWPLGFRLDKANKTDSASGFNRALSKHSQEMLKQKQKPNNTQTILMKQKGFSYLYSSLFISLSLFFFCKKCKYTNPSDI